MTTPIKAVRATIILGAIKLDVFQLPDGSYRYGYEFLASLIDRDKSILSDKKSPYSLQSILGKDKTDWNTKLTGISKGYTYNGLSDRSLMSVFGVFASLGCQPAISLLVACGIEALERRADAAFNIIRTEQERNEFFTARVAGIVARKDFTALIARHGYSTGNPEIYGISTHKMYDSIGLLESYEICKKETPKVNFRDTLDATELRMINNAEFFVVHAVETFGMNLFAALDKAKEVRK